MANDLLFRIAVIVLGMLPVILAALAVFGSPFSD
jgi:hypothetical protein